MLKRSFITPVALVAALLQICTPEASAGAQRTFVASTGNDANACSLAAPCRSFDAAVAQTLAGGEVIVLDSAGYGPATISQPVSIIAPPGIYAGVSVFSGGATGGIGIVVNAGAGTVTLRGLTINGLGGVQGISFQSGDTLYVDSVMVSGFPAGPSGGSLGVTLSGSGSVHVVDSSFRNNDVGASFESASGLVTVTIERSTFARNATAGIDFRGNVVGTVHDASSTESIYGVVVDPSAYGVGKSAKVEIRNSVLSDNYTGFGLLVISTAASPATVSLISSLASGNNFGVQSEGAGSVVYVTDSTITRNMTGMNPITSGTIVSGSDNRLIGNGTDGSFTSTTPKL